MKKKLLIVYNPQKPNIKTLLKRFLTKLKSEFRNNIGIKVCLSEKITEKLPKSDLIITLGGDGTILKVGDFAAKNKIPVAGVNLGTLGYLAEFNFIDIVDLIRDFIDGNLCIEERIILEVRYNNKTHYAINDCVIKPMSSKVCSVELFIDNQRISEFIGDGIIIATPTGSTAYSLACGGSIVEPDVNVMLVTPISPHTLSIRPLIISSQRHLKLIAPEYKSNKNMLLSLDGQKNFFIEVNDEVNIKVSKEKLLFIPNRRRSFYQILTHKLLWGKR
ncbi:MAG: NAD(+)/NADH kinase [Endomicrobia bacterium]|nr:NAD(+)/NADH kinase [Endomicrobiia bacterium]